MSIDKFGRHAYSLKIKGAKGPPGEGFKLTSDGDFDIGGKRMRNVGVPKDDSDVVTKKYLEEKRLVKVNDPIDATDAINKRWFEDHTLGEGKDEWNCVKRRLTDVADAIDNTDAINKKTLTQEINSLKSHVDGKLPRLSEDKKILKFGGMKIGGIADPEMDDEAVTMKFLNKSLSENIPIKSRHLDTWSFGNGRIVDVADPIFKSDAVNKKTLLQEIDTVKSDIKSIDERLESTLSLDDEEENDPVPWNGNSRRIVNVADPMDNSDAVNKKTLLQEIDTVKSDIDKRLELTLSLHKKEKRHPVPWDGKSLQIRNVGDPVEMSDAVNVKYIKVLIGEIVHSIYRSMGTTPLSDPMRQNFRDLTKEAWLKRYIYDKYFPDSISGTVIV